MRVKESVKGEVLTERDSDSSLSLTGANATTVTAVQGEESSPASNAAAFLLIFGIVVGVAICISVLQKGRQ